MRSVAFVDTLQRWESAELKQTEAPEILGVSERTFRRWLALRGDGEVGLLDRRLGKASGKRVRSAGPRRWRLSKARGVSRQMASENSPVWREMGNFEPLKRYGLEDTELSILCWLLWYRVLLDPAASRPLLQSAGNFRIDCGDYLTISSGSRSCLWRATRFLRSSCDSNLAMDLLRPSIRCLAATLWIVRPSSGPDELW